MSLKGLGGVRGTSGRTGAVRGCRVSGLHGDW